MKTRLLLLSMICLLVAVLPGCAKDEPEPEPEPVPSGPPPYFRWSVNNATAVDADSSFCYANSNVIDAFKNGNNNTVEIRIYPMTAGTYTITELSGNELTYQLGAATYTGKGSVTITSNITNKISGNFTCSLSGTGTLTSITGTFVDIPKRFN